MRLPFPHLLSAALLLAPCIAPARAGDAPATRTQAPAAAPLATLSLEPYRRGVAIRVSTGATRGLFVFDTAGGHSIVSPEFAAAAHCTPWGEIGGFQMTGKRLAMPRCDALAVDIGGFGATLPVAGVMQVAPLIAPDAAPVDGLLALDAFAGRTITLDFAGGRLYVESPASAAQRIAHARELPIRLSREVQGLALAVNLEVPTPRGVARFELDSGNGGTLLVSKAYAALFGLDPEAQGPQPAAIELAPGIVARGLAFAPGMNIDGNLGMPFLKDWIVTLDLAAGRLWLQPTQATPPPGMGVPPPAK